MRFEKIIEYFSNSVNSSEKYKPDLLIRYTYEFALSELSRDMLLRYFFTYIKIDINSTEAIDFDENLLDKLKDFADLLLNNFFVPLKPTGAKNPQPSSGNLSTIRSIQGPHDFIGTPERVANLCSLCLERDHHRCVLSQSFDYREAVRRISEDLEEALDDEGVRLKGQSIVTLQVAHIIPHSLMQLDTSSGLSESKKTAIQILNMFDYDVGLIINGPDIDRPRNAISLTQTAHDAFSSFEIFLEPVDGQEHTYHIKTLKPCLAHVFGLPLTRKLFLSDNQSIEPPSPRLLALHRAIAHILHLSGAGEYIDKILRDFENTEIRDDGTTELGRMIHWRMGGGLDGAVVH
ncbi:hypothetical protein PRK78_006169 [Emydomyces testavorans]|uniref:HNH nuclease domain-containing protein n=1 Tax=Emydomyces testavorans TaxID=2070801 RepID=A0AAF0DN01_9EURO|nr:hypothetical protein PRK78_006169 [Emydomyces testavorans]